MPLDLTQTANTAQSIATAAGATGAAKSVAGGAPYLALAETGINIVAQLLPEEKRAKFIQGATFGLVGIVFNWIKGKPYTEGQYVLGERFCDHILNKFVDRGYIKDRPGIVANAITFFTGALGVRIKTVEDLDALNGSPAYKKGQPLNRGLNYIDLGRTIVFPFTFNGKTYTSSKGNADQDIPALTGVDVYYLRPDHKDIPLKAVQRAAMLVQQYFPVSSYNKTAWDTSWFTKFPLVAPVPDPLNNGQLMNGILPGGMQMVNGLIAAPKSGDFLSQDVNALPGTTAAQIEANAATKQWLKWLAIGGGALVVILLIIFLARKK